MEMDLTLKIITLIALITFIILSVFAINSLISASKLIKEINNTLQDLSKDLIKTLNKLSSDFNELKHKSESSLNLLDGLSKELTVSAQTFNKNTQGLTKTISNYTGLFDKVHERIAPPINEVAVYISAIAKAITTFSGILSRTKKD